ncbi:spore-associated protein A [Streptomyces sp. SID4948]|nr:spore-associated protein A [Streptomyces sp. SID4948]
MRRVAVASALAATSAVGLTAFALPASAATPAANAAYNGACGSGYTVVDHTNISTTGTIYLTWNDRIGENCAATVRKTPGAALYMQAKVFQTDHTTVSASDSGNYTTYAGPVYIPARGECVTWRGQIGTAWAQAAGHCG